MGLFPTGIHTLFHPLPTLRRSEVVATLVMPVSQQQDMGKKKIRRHGSTPTILIVVKPDTVIWYKKIKRVVHPAPTLRRWKCELTIWQRKRNRMQIKTILNRVQKFKSFVYGTVHLVEGASVPTLEVELQPRLNSRPICSGCGKKRSGYDRSPERLFEKTLN